MDDLRIEYRRTDSLIPYARNPRENDGAVDRMAAAIREFGFRIPIVARSDGTVVDGHLRLKAAQKLGLETVPVALADELTPAQVRAFRLLANTSATWAKWDEDLLRIEFEELQDAGYDLALTGFDGPRIDEILSSIAEDEETAEETEQDEKGPPASRIGDLWICGEHRLFCGDSGDRGAIERLMNGGKARMVFTDPPYGVSIGSKNKMLQSFQKSGRITVDIINDTLNWDELQEIVVKSIANARQECMPDAAFYVCAPQGFLRPMLYAMQKAGAPVRTVLAWSKSQPTFSAGRLDYDYRHEPILFGCIGSPVFYGKGETGSVWSFPKPRQAKLHPTMKPVPLVESAILNSTKEGDAVLDVFGGSGTTMIAAERQGRTARLMELDPHYADVIVERWQAETGREATLEGEGKTFSEVKAEREAA